MRIRQVKPEFFRDRDVAELPFRTRLTYIGTWCAADDAGWFDANVEELALEMYGFDGVRARERWIVEDLIALQARGFIEVEPCGHALIPALVAHQRFAGSTKRVYTVQKRHERCGLSAIPADTRGDPRFPAVSRTSPPGKVGIGTVEGTGNGTFRNGTVGAQAHDEDGEPTEFQQLVPRSIALGGR